MDAPPARLPLVTIVCPVFNEEKSVELFFARLTQAMRVTEDKVRYELLFINNRSTDRTLEIVRGLSEQHANVNYLTLSRNFGYQASITAGMRNAKGDCVVNIDVDCEDPPEMIPRFIDKWLGGADIAYGIRHKREEFVLMHLARKLFYRVTRKLADHEIILDMAEFFLVDKRVRDFVLSSRSTFPFVRSQVGYVGFKREGIQYKRERRIAGETHYNIYGAARFGIAGILSSSTLMLRLLAYVGLVVAPLDFVLAIVFACTCLGSDVQPASWQRYFAALVLLHAGWLVAGMGVMGLYLARLYKDNVGLPLYIVDQRNSNYRELQDA
jgi:glycosyltransferase involved in cell wall biosynthesis